jgi:hypothetical protein
MRLSRMSLSQRHASATALRLLIPLAISIAPWPFTLALTHHASSYELEGDYYLTGFVGVLSFVLTGPFAGVALGPLLRDESIPFSTFAGLLFLVSLPTLSFQVAAFSSSILPGFMLGGPWTIRNETPYYVQAILLAFATYVGCALILYSQAKRGAARGLLAAVALSVGSFAIIVFRVFLLH